jgi:nitrate reductase gamma subunit
MLEVTRMFLDEVLFGAFPYAAVALAVAVTLYRYFTDRYSYSSFSSQFLENRALFWGSVPWHYGVLLILAAHVLVLIFPGVWSTIIAEPARLYTLEAIGLVLSLSATLGLLLLIGRRLINGRIMAVTSVMDWVLLLVLLSQMSLGFWVALVYRWGSDWYAHTAVPWLVSLIQLDPKLEFVTSLPVVIQLHMLGGFVIIALIPFTRMVHVFTVPVTYLWRPYQVVIWNRRQNRAS